MSSEKFASVSDVDSGVIDKLKVLLESIAIDSSAKNNQGLYDFLQKGFGTQAVQAWSFYAQVNNLRDFGNSSKVLCKLLKVLNNTNVFHEFGDKLVNLILTSYIQVLYRGLSNPTIRVTKPILELMNEMINFNFHSHLESFISYFDFSIPGLGRLLMPSKNDISSNFDSENSSNRLKLRSTFLKFWIQLISNCPALLRKDLITDNNRFMSVWLKYMDKADDIETITMTLDLFESKILNEPIFKRTTKTKILNEFALGKIHSYYNSTNKELVKKTNDFFLAYACNPGSNVAFPDYSVWFDESPINASSNGVPVTVNQKEFNIHNKLLFNVLKSFKPWEDDMQSSTVIRILEHVPELVAPYCNMLATQGSHDPKMSSYWFGMTLLLGRIINLKIPEFMETIETNMVPKTSLVIENIIPSSITKSALTNSLQHESMLIKQLTTQLITFAFLKLEKILDLYDRKGWQSSKVVLSNAFYSHLPDLTIITSVLNQVYSTAKENKILSLSLTEILKHYSKFYPNFFNMKLSVDNIYSDVMKSNTFVGINLAILEGFLQFQEYSDSKIKWWSSTDDSNSLFTSLLKLASSKDCNTSVSHKIVALLDRLLHITIFFNKHPCSPIYALVNSLQVLSQTEDKHSLQKLWKLLDNTIARCVKTPYKYYDISQDYENISPFVIVLLQQWNFVEDKENSLILQKWLCIFLKYMVSLGESQIGIKKACETLSEGIKEEVRFVYLHFDNYDNHISVLIKDEWLLHSMLDSSFYSYALLSPIKKLNKIVRVPVDDFDAIGVIFKLKLLIDDNSIKVDKTYKNAVELLVLKLASYVDVSGKIDLINTSIILPMFDKLNEKEVSTISKQKGSYTLLTIIDNTMGIGLINTSFKDMLSDYLNRVISNLEKSDESRKQLENALISCMDTSSVTELTRENFNFSKDSALIFLNKLNRSTLNLDNNIFLHFMTFKDVEILENLIKFFQDSRIENFKDNLFLESVITSDIFCNILDAYMRSSYFSSQSILNILQKLETNEKLSISIAISISLIDCKELTAFKEKNIEYCISKFGSDSFCYSEDALKLFNASPLSLSKENITKIQNYLVSNYPNKYKAPTIEFMRLSNNWDSENVKLWLNKLVLYITKSVSEKSKLSEGFKLTLSQYQELLKVTPIWELVNNNFLNSQLEAFFNSAFVKDNFVLKTVLIILSSSGSKSVESGKFMQQILNNESITINTNSDEEEEASFLTVSVIYLLFKSDETANSTRFVQEKLLEQYNGTIDVKDEMILNILENIESKTSTSWTNYIYAWEFLDDLDEDSMELIGEIKMVTRQREGLVVTLKKDLVQKTIKSYCMERPEIPEIHNKSCVETWESFETSHKSSLRLKEKASIYNPMFLLLLIIQNEELVHQTTVEENTIFKFEVKKLFSSKLLQFIICALGDKNVNVSNIALSLIKGMLISLEDSLQFKEGIIFKILFKRIAYTFEMIKANTNEKIKMPAPLVWFVISYIVEILMMPLSPLHEKCYKWVLNGHYIRYTEIPLLQELMDPTTKTSDRSIDYEHYYKHLSWMLAILETSINTENDVNLLKGKGVFEWLMNTMSSSYLNSKLKSMILSIFFKVERINNGGSTLMTRYAALSTLEIARQNVSLNLASENKMLEKNSKNKIIMKKSLVLKENELNIEEVLQSFAILIDSQKRLATWVSNDHENLVKRIRK
ncbi:hypothetical protein TPHA_0N01770 [Tetrapisispora phaffii CBS 4417]|uniref:Nucleolar pre-ribosomal-associated protein 1 n=1 Tax=Tetrapisispora phaffii (strain ATCC 24235 / CBS 4417 / NBRC 1672 / NRRL Y-8282 / UCD 70-5) TaxID=1071381 RepID=G8C1D0_TETPH|nr:hypothetical protein TPHA_0N01770 [Tetrapisispora phaffii CBS 4417]CCE65958.1 hypothetical protein TPHA_0N01770 [Tetrapisispora phaffii CBS 4417]